MNVQVTMEIAGTGWREDERRRRGGGEEEEVEEDEMLAKQKDFISFL